MEWTHTFLLTLPGFTIDNSEQNRRKQEPGEKKKRKKKKVLKACREARTLAAHSACSTLCVDSTHAIMKPPTKRSKKHSIVEVNGGIE
jgi:hypothetical protein